MDFVQGCTCIPAHHNFSLFTLHFSLIYGAVPVSTGVVRLDKRAVAPDHDKTGNF